MSMFFDTRLLFLTLCVQCVHHTRRTWLQGAPSLSSVLRRRHPDCSGHPRGLGVGTMRDSFI